MIRQSMFEKVRTCYFHKVITLTFCLRLGVSTLKFPLFNDNKNLTCYCDNKVGAGGDHRICIKNRCDAKGDFQVLCYVEKLSVDGIVERGCTYYTECWSELPNEIKTGIRRRYCCTTSLCNENIFKANLTYLQTSTTVHPKSQHAIVTVTEKANLKTGVSITKIVVYSVLPVTICVIIGVLFFIFKFYHANKTDKNGNECLILSTSHHAQSFHHKKSSHNSSSVEDSHSGSGYGFPIFVQRTISNEIKLREFVGNGSFGAVHRGEWRGQDVAVKIFSTGEEASWRREIEVYTTTMLQHENVLGFIASDNKDTGACTQLWLVCDYHANGSLYDFLQKQSVDLSILIKMVFGIVNGVGHLHSDILGAQGKPAMAHRDIKTKNILVKNDLTCCIADLGLTVLHSTAKNKIDMSPSSRTGTRRYHSPEILNHQLKTQYFESYQRADIYAMGLCIWEVCRRTEIDGEVSLYELPFYDCVEPDPSESVMRQAVCIEKRRPQFQECWHKEKVMNVLMKIMTECWYHEPAARLTALRIKRNLREIYNQYSKGSC